ncbi:carbon-nitrogen hydrolase family protein [Arthrobacter sp. NamB2]|uniref:carbon-nitrogen hydrolase family protein n=1 Tax=Arthrobacter sp. NamB2 TaxID=2576035 RepID=UPI0010C9E646|nr:carbon-nitrogen hydrolase family protein [Arthrobacter sp. NamB2]TKV28589.1 carbon-nitrogen hydrolase family protein [Arthrobacter sp. NamB2]
MRVAIAQMTSGSDPSENLEQVERLTREASAGGADLVVFPEATMCAFGNDLSAVVEPLDGPWASRVREIAVGSGIVIVAGMFTPGSEGRVRNTLLAVGPGVDTSYDKVHLFDAFGYRESDSVEPGTQAVTFALEGATVGLATCYDIRFPALFAANAGKGAQVNIVCASWGAGEGKVEQWSLLARARALDSTTFVVACGQADPASSGMQLAGSAPTGVGHSAVVSPLGRVIAELGPAPELAFVDIDTAEIDDARGKLPVLANARSF